ncbi:non-lysosomal glucosylceramidase [Agrilus planipennis]|uniref:Non-lysosomal glucosylceramidase n=1 Tax=Agrilus planipennis TaxID=224129 RepID=A0A1W4W6S7_AGRPL|nr:non-lysosomal glucosylceramidase [Agrilus planipennis]XP_018319799.1 non-lysosomal glucosylceramidase [Agrilus planipennis]XP_018319800.1 non-lysosomal glucosylceramidase [Agrilus planipennis]
MESDEEARVPKYGFKVSLDYQFPENWTPRIPLKIKQLIQLLPLMLRYLWYYIIAWWHKRKPTMDYIKPVQALRIYGVPLGGIGSGTIGRGFKGEFCRYTLRPGNTEYHVVEANQFIVTIKNEKKETILQSLLSTYKRKTLKAWKNVIKGSQCKYTGLYPRAWTEYDLSEYGIILICRQISPVIPHNYTDSSLPCGIFVWEVKNFSNEERTITIALTIKNGTGDKHSDKAYACRAKGFSYLDKEGIVIHHQIDKMNCSYTLATKADTNRAISKCMYFDPNSDGSKVWKQLHDNGRFDNVVEKSAESYKEMGCAIASQVLLFPSQQQNIEFCLVWDMPNINFHLNEKKYFRYYTKIFGRENTSLKIMDYAFNNYRNWEKEIYKWQESVLNDDALPDWYKGVLFNQTYFISDGGTVWLDIDEEKSKTMPASDPRQKYGQFAILEGAEYRMYNTYDVHFYASFAFAMNWPQLQRVFQYEIRDTIFMEMNNMAWILYDGKRAERKIKNTVPHDIGDPWEEPFIRINAYNIHDVSEWRDLGVKFVLEVFRDYTLWKKKAHLDTRKYLEDMYGALKIIMQKFEKFDEDGDGLIENSGTPDQTFDSWIMTGASAYCGGLWLAALRAMIEICNELGKEQAKEKYQNILKKGTASFDKKLWNGSFYSFDAENPKIIMADQLCAHWYLKVSGIDDYSVFPKDKVRSAFDVIFKHNVKQFYNGKLGAVNGYIVDGGVDEGTIQSEESWTGVTYGLAAGMLAEEMLEEAWQTAGGMSETLEYQIGLAFETPEALFAVKVYRSVSYMRPLSIWAMQLAWENRKNYNVKVA